MRVTQSRPGPFYDPMPNSFQTALFQRFRAVSTIAPVGVYRITDLAVGQTYLSMYALLFINGGQPWTVYLDAPEFYDPALPFKVLLLL